MREMKPVDDSTPETVGVITIVSPQRSPVPKIEGRENGNNDVSIISDGARVNNTRAGGQENIIYWTSSATKSIIKLAPVKAVHLCLVCNKVGICKYNMVCNNNNEKHLCGDACFDKFRLTPTLFLQPNTGNPLAEVCSKDDDLEVIKMIPPPLDMKTLPCAVCNLRKPAKHEVSINRKMKSLCSDKCLGSFRCKNKLSPMPCGNCGALCIARSEKSSMTEEVDFEGTIRNFCGKICLHTFRSKNKKTLPCAWCKQKKSSVDMVEWIDSNEKQLLFCSMNCVTLYRVNLQVTSNQEVRCDQCRMLAPAHYHLTMTDSSIQNFCSYPCVINFQSQYSEQINARQLQPVKDTSMHSPIADSCQSQNEVPVITDVVSLASKVPENKLISDHPVSSSSAQTTHIITLPPKPLHVKNKSVFCKPLCQSIATSCRPNMQTKSTQTDIECEPQKILLPVPVPIYVPAPMAMYAAPQPYPIPIPIPIPIPCFIPTTKLSTDEILKQIKEIHKQISADHSAEEEEKEDTAASLPAEPLKCQPKPEVTTGRQPSQPQMALRRSKRELLVPGRIPPPVPPNSVAMAQNDKTKFRRVGQNRDSQINITHEVLHSSRGRRGHGYLKRQHLSKEPLLSEFSKVDQSIDILTNAPYEAQRSSRGRHGHGGRGCPKRCQFCKDSVDTEFSRVNKSNDFVTNTPLKASHTHRGKRGRGSHGHGTRGHPKQPAGSKEQLAAEFSRVNQSRDILSNKPHELSGSCTEKSSHCARSCPKRPRFSMEPLVTELSRVDQSSDMLKKMPHKAPQKRRGHARGHPK